MIRPAISATVFIRLIGRAAHRRRGVDADRRRPGRGHPLHRPPHLEGRVPKTDYGYGSAISVIVLYLTLVMCWILYVALVAPRTRKKRTF